MGRDFLEIIEHQKHQVKAKDKNEQSD